jgi:two-component system, chemotaxis family, protein-glutamate methylesterase/glutaminase
MINQQRLRRDIVTIGASAGGIDALLRLFKPLPHDFPAAVGVVLHRSPLFESNLAQLLQSRSKLQFLEPQGAEPLEPGHVYIAPRDRHMLFESSSVRLDRGPKQHFTRPAADPLFVSAAESFGPRVVGVVLTGGGDDGASGLIAIKKGGGLSLVQDPREAQNPSMPAHGIVHDGVDAVLTIAELSDVLALLARGEAVRTRHEDPSQPGGGSLDWGAPE